MRISDWSSDVCSSDLKVDGNAILQQRNAPHMITAADAGAANRKAHLLPKTRLRITPGEQASASRSATATLSLKEPALTNSTPPGSLSLSERASSFTIWPVPMMAGSPPAPACRAVQGMAEKT